MLAVVLGAVLGLVSGGCESTDAPTSPGTAPTGTPTAAVPASSTPPGTCSELAAAVVDTLQDYLDQFAGRDPSALGQPAAGSEPSDLQAEARRLGRRAEQLGCDPDTYQRRLAEELERLEGEGPAAAAVGATFRSQLLGGPDPSDPPPVRRRVGSGDELVAAVAAAGSGSTILLRPGTFRLTEPLVLLRPISLRGAGRGATRLVSTAPGAAVLVLAPGRTALEDLTVRHEGTETASVVVVRAGAARLASVRITGGTAPADTPGGFGLVLRSTPSTPTGADRSATVVTDSLVAGNRAGGIAIAGSEAPTVHSTTVRDNGGCGVCYLQRAAGILVDSRLEANGVGVELAGRAGPTLRANTVAGSGEVGILYTRRAAGRAVDNAVSGSRLGIQIAGHARPELDGNRITDIGEAAVVVAGSGRGTVTGTACPDAPAGIVLLDDAAPALDGNDCAVVDQRKSPEERS